MESKKFRVEYTTMVSNLPRNCCHIATILSKYGIARDNQIYYKANTDSIVYNFVYRANNTVDLHCTLIRYDLSQFGNMKKFKTMEKFVDELLGKNLTNHEKQILKFFIRSDMNSKFEHANNIVSLYEHNKLKSFTKYLCNTMFERGYENKYPFGQQLSIYVTTNKMQEGLNFKHSNYDSQIVNSWKGDKICSVTKPYSLMQILEFNKFKYNFTFFEIKNKHIWTLIKDLWFDKTYMDWKNNNIIAVEFANAAEQECHFATLKPYFEKKEINLLMMTNFNKYDSFINNFYFALKIFYYLVTRKYYFDYDDITTIQFLSIITIIRIRNKNSLASFNSNIHPLAAYSRRQSWLKKAANQHTKICNDSNLKLDFLKGCRLNLGAGDNDLVIKIDQPS
ncbi:transcription regulator [Neodiprion abietis nucleopolyhedrovirus]|uniref:Transcription regulator n=1 Tax=Neodiprion abietis nucleopolyhedrovirus TaxID=204507 RepID=Q0ZP31_9CBAC|nr:transcription regulator [Neodiprion abietis nucleopolyhedrovirus]ABC74923.1 transcription regulator [Neodiprion abietis nucleopolyhedrovirus]